MWRRLSAVAFVLACFLIAEPLLHAHPLGNNSDGTRGAATRPCGICATGVNRLPTTAPTLAAPVAVLYLLSAPERCDLLAAPSVSFESRGPPRS
jgi:hypothetical protein